MKPKGDKSIFLRLSRYAFVYPQMKGADAGQTANTVAVPEGVDADLLMKVLGNPEMAALLTSLAKSLKAE